MITVILDNFMCCLRLHPDQKFGAKKIVSVFDKFVLFAIVVPFDHALP